MFRQTWLKTLTLAAIFAGLWVYTVLGGTFAKELVVEIAILAILAISLDLIAGFAGMISLAQGAVSGVGAYAFAGANVLAGVSPSFAIACAIGAAATFGTLLGAVTARTRGIYFIM